MTATRVYPKGTKVTYWPKLRDIFNRDLRKQQLKEKTKLIGDPDSTGKALAAACVEMSMSLTVLLLIRMNEFGYHTAIEAFLILAVMANMFWGMLLTCYMMVVQFAFIMAIFIVQIMQYNVYLPRVIPRLDHMGMFSFCLLTFGTLTWCILRFTVTRRALYFIYIEKEEKKMVDLEAAAEK